MLAAGFIDDNDIATGPDFLGRAVVDDLVSAQDAALIQRLNIALGNKFVLISNFVNIVGFENDPLILLGWLRSARVFLGDGVPRKRSCQSKCSCNMMPFCQNAYPYSCFRASNRTRAAFRLHSFPFGGLERKAGIVQP